MKKIVEYTIYNSQASVKIIDEEIGKINKTLFNDVSVEEMKSLKQTMSKLQKCVEKEE